VNARARELIQLLELERHPEGGYYREVFRSPREVRVSAPADVHGPSASGRPASGRPASGTPASGTPASGPPASGPPAPPISRSAITTIYFLLVEGEPSGWHSVASDEIWHHLEGAPGELTELSLETSGIVRHHLGPLGGGTVLVATIPAGHWQSARTLGAYTLVGCTVGPGFDFEDFKLLADDPEAGERVRRLIGDVKAS
jgi:predicted cupin superfamily sugar epimerase